MSTATTSSTQQLLHWLIQAQFIRANQADDFRDAARFPDPHAIAKEMIRRGWITPYQANQILNGKGNDLIFGDCRLLERLGEGAMGQVYKAWSLRLARIVALKVIHKDHVASGKAMDRFRREIQAASGLDHPNIVLVRSADEVEGRPYMVMDFIEGIDLSRLVKQNGPLLPAEACEYVRQAALGLQHAFERKIVHRDIKPGNLVLTKGPDGGPLIKILDFGLARFESEREVKNRLTVMGALLGTVDYVAPEQAENAQKADIRADIFALGCTLFYLIAGKPPYPGATVVEKITARLLNEPPSVRSLRPDAPAALDAVLKKMMARSPEVRFQTPLEVAMALKLFAPLGHTPLPADILRLPPAPDIPIARPLPDGPPPVQADHDVLAFSSSNHDLDAAQLLRRATKNPMSRGSEAFQRLMKNKTFVFSFVGGFVALFLLVVVLVLASR